MARILLSAYACEPCRGSEPGVGWNWAIELAQLGHRVTVLTRSDNRASIDQAEGETPPHLSFLYYDLPLRAQWIRRLPGGKPLYYVLWQWLAVRFLRQTLPQLPFDIVQHVTYVSARFPSFMGSLGIPFIFGPVSGGEAVPACLRYSFSLSQQLRERLRDLSNRLIALDPLMRRTFRQASRILVTPDTLALIPKRWHHKCETRLAIGLTRHDLEACQRRRRRATPPFRLLYVGRLLEWKGLGIALRAINRLKRSHPDVVFTIIGDGPARSRLMQLSLDPGVLHGVRWTGWLPRSDVEAQYGAADLLLFPSLRDSGGSVVLEAIAHGLPVICTDLGGPGVIVDETCGRVVPTHQLSSAQVACEMSEALGEILSTPSLLASLSAGARVRARQFAFQDLALSVHPAPPMRIVSRKA